MKKILLKVARLDGVTTELFINLMLRFSNFLSNWADYETNRLLFVEVRIGAKARARFQFVGWTVEEARDEMDNNLPDGYLSVPYVNGLFAEDSVVLRPLDVLVFIPPTAKRILFVSWLRKQKSQLRHWTLVLLERLRLCWSKVRLCLILFSQRRSR